ncbi:MAG: hypothetical protein H6Q72_4230, partial [Firmicutes bacterium]|nr:hypothetical protein [Bacillota bacterium]
YFHPTIGGFLFHLPIFGFTSIFSCGTLFPAMAEGVRELRRPPSSVAESITPTCIGERLKALDNSTKIKAVPPLIVILDYNTSTIPKTRKFKKLSH